MAGETILVVDDVEVNLKLADILLRKEGYKVHTAPSAEDALGILRNLRPDLILVDFQLPGMSGLELTERIKREYGAGGARVIAFTASTKREDRQKAMEAGCDGYITKPVDTEGLAAQIRMYLDCTPEPAAAEPEPSLPGGLRLSDIESESLRRRFLEEGALQTRQMLLDLGARLDAAQSAEVVHRWIGSAGALGYTQICELAQQVETLLCAPGADAGQLREALTDLAYAFTDPRESSIGPLPDSIVRGIEGKRVGLVAFAPEEAERLCSVLESFGALPRLFDANEQPCSGYVLDCDAIMAHVRPETMDSSWFSGDSPAPRRPFVLVGKRGPIMALDPAIQSRASEFLIDGWQPEEALMRLSFALSRSGEAAAGSTAGCSRTGQFRVVIADDDANVTTLVRATLEDYDMECRTAATGVEAFQVISEYRPHAAVLDLNMPGMDGFSVLANVRRSGLPVSVVLLTARRQEKDVIHGFNLGADDYVMKPFNPIELVVRIRRLIRPEGW
jgi:DNA-binding response OmpR family regulator